MADERKLVTILFADVVGSTALGSENEPEVVRDLMARYFERMKGVAETYGGTVEKFIGDAVMVVFGVPRLHDDDAERAVRCALGMQDAMASLNREFGMSLAVRVGVNSGRAVTGGAEGKLITGDSVNVAARLQQGAEPAEIVVGPLTEELTRQVIEYRHRMPVPAKGKVEPIKAFTVVRARNAVPRHARRLGAMQAPLVGRDGELRLLLDTFARVTGERRAHLFTVLGSAGVGKSRLVQEALTRIAASAAVRVLQGRCLPYGTGITYWPVREILREDAGIALEDDRDTAQSKLERRLSALIPSTAQRRAIRNRLSVVLGIELPADSMADVPADRVDHELVWGVRQHVQAAAVDRPLAIVIDDLQWAEPIVVQLLEQIALRVTEHPILLVCIARTELLEAYPNWGGGKVNTATITLNPLAAAETSALISRLLEVEDLPPQLRERLVERSEGNPLFCEEFLRLLIDEMRLVRVQDRWRAAAAATDTRVPETIHALLAARLDGLPEADKRTFQAASIVGERFNLRQIRAIISREDIEDALEDLLLKGLVVEDASATDSSQLRFKHLLIRDVAYEAIPKDERALFHERFERHLQADIGDREHEFAEILAYHAERAFTLSREMRITGMVLQHRAERALKWNLLRAERALSREDATVLAACLSVAEFAAAVAPPDQSTKLRLRLLAAESLRLGARFAEALGVATEAVELATEAGDQQAAAAAHVCASKIALRQADDAACRREAAEAARLYRLAGDPAGEMEAESTLVWQRLGDGDGWPAIEDTIKLAHRAKQSGAPAKAAQLLGVAATFASSEGFSEHAEQCLAEAAPLVDQLGLLRFSLDKCRARLTWLRGGLAQAEEIMQRSLEVLEDTGGVYDAINLRRDLAKLLVGMGRYEDADAVLDRALKDSLETGERWNRAELLARRAMVAVHRRDLRSAEQYAEQAVEAIVPGDGSGQAEAHYALGRMRTAQGREAEADAEFRLSLEALKQVVYSDVTVEFTVGIARFLAERGRMAEAMPLLDTAQAWLERAGYALWMDEIGSIRQLASAASPI